MGTLVSAVVASVCLGQISGDPFDALPPGEVEVVVLEARELTQRPHSVDIPAYTHIGWGDTYALRLGPPAFEALEAWVDANERPGDRSLRLEVTIVEATASWQARASMKEHEHARVQVEVRLLDPSTGRVLRRGKGEAESEASLHDADAETLLARLDRSFV